MTYKLKTKELIGKALINWRKNSGKNQHEIAETLGITTPMYKSYEYQQAEPSIITLKRLADLYGLKNIEDLIDLTQLIENAHSKKV